MDRIKSYDLPHKALRNALSQLSLLSGKTDCSNARELKALHQLGLDVFKILTIHAADENDVALAELEIRCPGGSQSDMEDHDKIHIEQHNLEKLLESIISDSKEGKDVRAAMEEFYLAFSEFHGKYLQHIAEEERITQLLLWKYFSDEELISHRQKIMSKMVPETLFTWFRFIISAQTHQERIGFFTGFKKTASPPLFDKGVEVIKKELAADEFNSLMNALGN